VAKSFKAPLAAAVGCAVALMMLGLVVYGIDPLQHADAALLARIMTHTGAAAGPVVNAVAHLADPIFVLLALALACGIALQRRRPLDAAAALTVIAGANLTAQLLKVLLAHPRFQPVLGHNQMPAASFPSGHATAAASMAIAFLFVVPNSWRPTAAVLGACLVAAVDACVLILAWHFPSDVLGGTLVAAGWGFAVLAVLRFAATPAPARPPPQLSSRAAIPTK
jgi:membrane-associated phospholipid phosphatase